MTELPSPNEREAVGRERLLSDIHLTQSLIPHEHARTAGRSDARAARRSDEARRREWIHWGRERALDRFLAERGEACSSDWIPALPVWATAAAVGAVAVFLWHSARVLDPAVPSLAQPPPTRVAANDVVLERPAPRTPSTDTALPVTADARAEGSNPQPRRHTASAPAEASAETRAQATAEASRVRASAAPRTAATPAAIDSHGLDPSASTREVATVQPAPSPPEIAEAPAQVEDAGDPLDLATLLSSPITLVEASEQQLRELQSHRGNDASKFLPGLRFDVLDPCVEIRTVGAAVDAGERRGVRAYVDGQCRGF